MFGSFVGQQNRLQGRDGIVCLVTNNSFVDQISFDGMRKHLLQDFTQIYHIDLHGNVRKNPKLSGTTHNVFGIQVRSWDYHCSPNLQKIHKEFKILPSPENWRRTEKLTFLKEKGSIVGIDWSNLQPDERQTWITEGLHSEFSTFLSIGTREAKNLQFDLTSVIFRTYSAAVKTNRDIWVYDLIAPPLKRR